MWRHESLRDCKMPIGQGFIEIDEHGLVVAPTPYAEAVLRRYGSVTGFSLAPNTPTTETPSATPVEPAMQEPAAQAPKRRGRLAGSRG